MNPIAVPTYQFEPVAVRAASGLAAGALIALAVLNLLQVFPPKLRPAAMVSVSLYQSLGGGWAATN